MGLKRKQLSILLGIKKRQIAKYEKGKAIPKTVALACYALSRGVSEFDGKTAKNSFNGLGAAEDIVMDKSKSTSKKAQTEKSKNKHGDKMRLAKKMRPSSK